MLHHLNFSLKKSKKVLSTSFGAAGFLFVVAYVIATATFAPATASAVATSSVVVTLNVTAGIAISSPTNTTMSTALGVSQSTAIGTTTWTVNTNDSAGYTLGINATTSPAMQSGASTIADYQTGAPNTWSVTSGTAAFGYSVFGTDSPTGTWGTGTQCAGAADTNSTTLKYKGFTTSPFVVAQRAATTTPTGISTTVCYAVQQNNFYVPSGTYTATIVATATAL